MSIGINSRSIDDLHPAVARGCREFIRRMNQAGFPHVGISATFRDNEHQNWLFAQGRTRPGSIVTHAQGGQSIHNFRLAFDFFRNIQGQAFNDRTPEERRFWDTAGQIWTKMGGVWGGNWTGFVDRPHCEYTGGLSLRDLQKGMRLPDNHRMPWENGTKGETDMEEREVRINGVSHMIPGVLINDRNLTGTRALAELLGADVTNDGSIAVIEAPWLRNNNTVNTKISEIADNLALVAEQLRRMA